ncbi:helix-turn-helix domain-containing protein [Streptomyces sp. NPDC057729]|uniref:helix-turn-helix domain-containing protein n=1 Tax=Streptomyces sp. NPDC057729 TaxID=3346230 RepID=UPI00369D7172
MKNEMPAFASWLTDTLTASGYDLSPKGGGRTRFAADSGISPSTVGRLLQGQGATNITTLEQLATALRRPLPEILVRAGVLTQSDLEQVATRDPNRPPITPDEAADELGITDPQARKVFRATIDALRTPPPHTGG